GSSRISERRIFLPLFLTSLSGGWTNQMDIATASASRTLVLPEPFSPTSTVNRGWRSKSSFANFLKFSTWRRSILMRCSISTQEPTGRHGDFSGDGGGDEGAAALL